MKKKIIYVLCGMLTIGALSAGGVWLNDWLKASEKMKIDLMDGVEVVYEGWNKEGKARIKRNEISYDGSNETIHRFIDSIQIHVTPDSGLRNGDTVKVKAVYSENARSLANVDIVRSSMECTVEGLNGESMVYEYDDDLNEKVTIDGYEIPEGIQTEEGRQDYVAMQKIIDGKASVEEKEWEDIWYQGESDTKTDWSDTTFPCSDYEFYRNAFYDAYDFGQASSQRYKIETIFENDQIAAYKVVFEKGGE